MKTEIYNNTTFTPEDISGFKFLGTVLSNFRARVIQLYQHPHSPDKVISVGETIDHSMRVICSEFKQEWERELKELESTPQITTL